MIHWIAVFLQQLTANILSYEINLVLEKIRLKFMLNLKVIGVGNVLVVNIYQSG